MNSPPPSLRDAMLALEASRASLRLEMIPPNDDAPDRQSSSALPRRARAWWRSWRQQLGRWPVAALAMAAVGEWWQQHPWRPAGELLAGEWRDGAMPLLRRHPVASVMGACALGAALAAGRPWRWPMVAAQVRPLPRRVARWLLLQLRQPPVQTALVSLVLMLAKAGVPPDAPRQPSPTTGPDAGR